MQRLLVLAAFLVALLSPVFAAQDQTPSTKSEDAMWRVATGLVKAADGRMVPLPPGETILRETEAALAREMAQAEVTRDFAAAAQRLAALRARATWHEVPRRELVLTNIAVARAKLLQRVGDVQGALRALDEFYLREGEELAEPLGLRPASFEEMRLRALALSTSSVRSLTEKLKKAAEAPTDTDDAIASAVGGALSSGNGNGIYELGKRAVPALLRLAAQGTDAWVAQTQDPLFFLTRLDEARAAQLILEHFDRGGPFWRRRALRAMQQAYVLENESGYLYEPRKDSRPRLIGTWWPPVVLRLIQDPETAQEALTYVHSLLKREALDEPLLSALSMLVRSSDPALTAAVQKILRETLGYEGTKKVLESMLDAGDPLLRDFSSRNLLSYRETAGLKAAARSSDPKVRLAVVNSLRARYVARPDFDFNSGTPRAPTYQEFQPVLDAADFALLEALVRDVDPLVRREAVMTATQNGKVVLADSTWLELARDPDAAVRRQMAFMAGNRVSPSTAVQLFRALARDNDTQVLEAWDDTVITYLGAHKQGEEIDALLPALEARFANESRPFLFDDDQNQKLTAFTLNVWKSGSGRKLLSRWALSGNPSWRLAVIAQLKQALRQGGARELAKVIPLDDADLVRLLREAAAGNPAEVYELARFAAGYQLGQPQAWRALVLDQAMPVPLRVAAARGIARDADAQIARAVVELVSSAAWSEWKGTGPPAIVGEIFGLLPEPAARQALAELLERETTPAVKSQAAEGFSAAHAFTPALSEALLRQMIRGPDWLWDAKAGVAALKEVASRAPEDRGTWIEQAARSYSVLSRPTVELLGQLRDPRYFPLLVESLDHGGVQLAAIEAIGRYLDDKAVEALLDAAGKFTDAKLRQACYDELNRIKSHLATRDEWEARRRAGATKDAAITALLPMLDSKDVAVRAQAARSLATLGAVEELPRLVKLLQDPEPNVRQAAQRALEVLNSSTATPR